MARHNRDGKGVDQHGELWVVSYQPDWLRHVKISRELPDGRRRSTLTLVENPAHRARGRPGRIVRTRVRSADGSVHFQVALEDKGGQVEEITVEMDRERPRRSPERIKFVIRGGLAPPAR